MKIKISVLFLVFVGAFVSLSHAYTFPQLAIGGGYETVLIVSSKTNLNWEGRLRVRQGNNQRWVGTWSINGSDFTGVDSATFTLESWGSRKFIFRGDATMRVGYLEVPPHKGRYACGPVQPFS